MADYRGLQYRTKGNANPQGRPRVFFCCHSEDFERMFEPVTKEILDIQENAAIWYYDPKEGIPEEEGLLTDLSQMQLFVLPVTANFIYKENPARNIEFAYAVDHHIPVLPLMQETGLESDFNRICGDLQFLDKEYAKKDVTAIPYEEKLKQFLESVLVGDELAQKVRNAFAAYIFLSYRKKDRKYAQDIMKLIHKNDFCRDIAIWYDEFLTPGENFNDAIAGAMQKSSAFAFVVTPNLLENPNYVMTVEYKEAKKTGKPMLPIQGKPTSARKLAALYDGIDTVITEKELPVKLKDTVGEFAEREINTDPVHEYLIGLAYLSGIDVEVDHERALTLISSAAEKRLPVAYQKLVSMYRTGEGVARNYEKAIELQKKYAAVMEDRWKKEQSEVGLNVLIQAYWSLGNYQKEKEQVTDAKKSYETMRSYAMKLKGSDRGYYNRISSNLLGGVSHDEGSISETRKWYKKNLNNALKNVKKKRTDDSLRELSSSYYNLGYLSQKERDLKGARENHMKALEIREKLADKNSAPDVRYLVMESYSNLGEISRLEGKPVEQKEWHQKALEIAERLVRETSVPKYRRALCICYGKMAEICRAEGNLKEEMEWYQKILKHCQELVKETDVTEDHSRLAETYNSIGTVCSSKGQYSEADNWYRKALAVREKLAEETNTIESRSNLASVYGNLGSLRLDQGNYKDARQWFMKCLEIRGKLAEEFNTFEVQYALSGIYETLALTCSAEKDYKNAKVWYQKALQIREEKTKGKQTVNILRKLGDNYSELGDICMEEGNTAEAKAWYQKAFDTASALTEKTDQPADKLSLATCCLKLGDVSKKEGDLSKAENLYRRGLKIARKLSQNTESVMNMKCLTKALFRMGSLQSISKEERSELLMEYIEINQSLYTQTGNKDYLKIIMTAPVSFNMGKGNLGLIKEMMKLVKKQLRGK